MTTVSRGGDIRLDISFYEYFGGDLFDPDQPLTFDIQINEISVLDTVFTYDPGDIIRDSLGRYHLTWSVPLDAALEIHVAVWNGTINGTVVEATESFLVVSSGYASADEPLGEELLISFGGIFDPMYLDPDEILVFFSDSNYLEVAEAVHNASVEVKAYLKLSDTAEPPFIGLEYVKAATLCALSRIYPLSTTGVENGFGQNVSSIKLGDFSVDYGGNNGTSFNVSGSTNRGNAANWCELAEALRREMLFSNVGMKAVVKGSKYINPIPNRELKSFKSRSQSRFVEEAQGLLDGPSLN